VIARLAALAALLTVGCGGKTTSPAGSGGSGGVGAGGTGGGGGNAAGSGGTAGTPIADAAPVIRDAGPPDGSTMAADAAPTSVACPRLSSAGLASILGPGAAAMLPQAVANAPAGFTILLMDGTYPLNGASLRFRTAGVTLSSASGDASKVIIDGEYKTAEAVVISASDVTISHLTITRAVDHPVHIYPETTDVKNPRLYGLRIIDGGEQFVKVNPNAGRTNFVDGGRLECSFLQLTEAGRPMVESLGGTSCYTGGIDVHAGRGWTVRSNRFEDIYCRTGKLAEHAIHFWTGSRDTVVENNTIVNCARGIGFGLVASGDGRAYPDDPYPGRGYIGHYDGLIRNNAIHAGIPQYDTGIELAQARGVRVYHNTVFAGAGATAAFSSIDARFTNTLADVRNNLVNRLTVRDGAVSNASSNREMAPASDFANPVTGDLHLTAGATDAIDKGVPLPEAGLDLDGQTHTNGAPDLGADER
jgi:hypothetical protein